VEVVIAEQATHDDVGEVAALADARRGEAERHQPLFWRKAENALEVHREYLHGLVDDPEHIFLVARQSGGISGFVIGRLLPAPPVYDPGGLTCLVDDFAVAAADEWATLGVDLLRAVAGRARGRGAIQVVVVAGRHDTLKGQALQTAGLAVASEWWVAPCAARALIVGFVLGGHRWRPASLRRGPRGAPWWCSLGRMATALAASCWPDSTTSWRRSRW
jgi:hypothetical protein